MKMMVTVNLIMKKDMNDVQMKLMQTQLKNQDVPINVNIPHRESVFDCDYDNLCETEILSTAQSGCSDS